MQSSEPSALEGNLLIACMSLLSEVTGCYTAAHSVYSACMVLSAAKTAAKALMP